MQGTLLQQGWELLLYGMGIVFVFLTILVIATTIMSAIVRRYPAPEAPLVPARHPSAPASDNSRLTAVISAAIHAYRSRHK